MKLLDYTALQERGIRYSKPHLWRLWSAGKFPKPVKLSPSRNTWLESDIDAWIEGRVAKDKRHELPPAAGTEIA